jgi:hypothetical protein
MRNLMHRLVFYLGWTGLLLLAASALFAWMHPTGVVVLAIMANAALLAFGLFLFGIVRQMRGSGRPVSANFLLFLFSFLFLVVLVNVMLHYEMSRAKVLAEPLRKILRLQGKSYEFKNEQFAAEKFPEGRVTGVIAQEIEKVLPELVATRGDGYKGVAYEEIVPVLIEAVKEQQKTIDSQRKEIAEIRIMVQGMKKKQTGK